MLTTIISKNSTTLNLETLLSQLRLRGIAVGTTEMQRLHHVFEQSPQLSHSQLRNLLSVMLAKNDKQREILNRLFDRLIHFEKGDVPRDLAEGNQHSEKPKTVRKSQYFTVAGFFGRVIYDAAKKIKQRIKVFSWNSFEPINIFYTLLFLLAFIIVILSFMALEQIEEVEVYLTQDPKIEVPSSTTIKEVEVNATIDPKIEVPSSKPIKEISGKPGKPSLDLVKTIDYWSAHIESAPIDPWPKLLPWLTLLLGSGFAFSWLFHKALMTTRRQMLKPPNIKAGRGRFQVPELTKRAEYYLLSGKQRKEMRWGINRYLSEQPLRRLDIKASVESSAKAGMPEIKFLHTSEEREVWLWQDQRSNNRDLLRLVEEISHSFERGNIPVQKGYFRSIPSRVLNAQKEIIWSNCHEFPVNEPLVLIFADAESLVRQQQQDIEQSSRTLRQLSQWEHLCFVDNSYQPGTLQRLLEASHITCLLPQQVPEWLAKQGQELSVFVESCSLDNLRQWLVACALPTRIITEDEIRAVHDAMGLSCEWQFHTLERYAVKVGVGFDFRVKRVELLNEIGVILKELKQNYTRCNHEKAEFVYRAILFWKQRNIDIDESLTATDLYSPLCPNSVGRKWKNTELQQTLKLDSALLQLWQQPIEAAKALSDIFAESKLSSSVSDQLNLFSCLDFGEASGHQPDTQIKLPYSWYELDTETQRQLLHCGFGGTPDVRVSLRWDKATRFMLAGFALLALVGLVFSSLILMQNSEETLTRLDSPEPLVLERITSEQQGFYLLATYKSIGLYDNIAKSERPLQDKRQLTISWTRKEAQAAQFDLDKDLKAQLWLLGEIANPRRPILSDKTWPDLSIAVIRGDPKDVELRRLAAKLLDTGSVDQVLLGSGIALRKHNQKLIKQSEIIQSTQWLYVGGSALDHYDLGENKIVSIWKKTPKAMLDLLSLNDDVFVLPSGETNGIGFLLKAEKR